MGPQNRQGSYMRPMGMQGFGQGNSQMPPMLPQQHNPGQEAVQGINPINMQQMQPRPQSPMGPQAQAFQPPMPPAHGGQQQPMMRPGGAQGQGGGSPGGQMGAGNFGQVQQLMNALQAFPGSRY